MKLRLILFGLVRRPGGSLAAVFGVVLAAAMAFAGGLILIGVNHAAKAGTQRLGADLMVVPEGTDRVSHTAMVMGEPAAFYMDGVLAQQVAAIPGVARLSPQVYVETLASSTCCTGRIFLVGFDPSSDFTVKPWLMEQLGRDLAADEVLVGNHVLMVSGETMRFYGTEFSVAARMDPTGMGMDETVFLPIPAVQQMAADSLVKAETPLSIPPEHISALMVQVDENFNPAQVAAQIETSVPGVTAVTSGQMVGQIRRDLADLMTWLVPIAGAVLVLSVLLLGILFGAAAAQRIREIGLLRAVGASASQAAALVAGEALLLGLLGGGVGVLAGWGVYGVYHRAILLSYTLPYLWPSPGVQVQLGALIVVGSAVLAALAAAHPAWRLAKLEPHHMIHGAPRTVS